MQPGRAALQKLDVNGVDKAKIVILFDLNGTLTTHTAAKHSGGKSVVRPGIKELRRLQVRFIHCKA